MAEVILTELKPFCGGILKCEQLMSSIFVLRIFEHGTLSPPAGADSVKGFCCSSELIRIMKDEVYVTFMATGIKIMKKGTVCSNVWGVYTLFLSVHTEMGVVFLEFATVDLKTVLGLISWNAVCVCVCARVCGCVCMRVPTVSS